MATVRNPFDDLESNDPAKVEEFKVNIKEQFNRTKDPWILNGVYDYFMKTQSLRAVDVMAIVTEPHDKHFLDRASEGLRSPNKLQHLTLLGYLVRRRPIWLYKIFHHNLWHQLLSILKMETDIVIIVSALLILNILITSVPRLIGPVLPDIFAVFSKLAALNTNSNNYQDVQLVHLQISLYTLFHRLYGMFPNNFINFLRKEYLTTETYPVFSHTVKPMLDTVRVNHLLISANETWEVEPTRWNNIETHDIIVSCANLLMNGGSSTREYHQQTIYEPKPTFNCNKLLGALKVTGKQTVAEYCKQLGKGVDDPTSLSPSVRFLEKRPMESIPAPIPLTPITRGYEVSSPYSEHEGSSPPEAAIEATPETTPIGDRLTTAPPPSLLMTTAGRPLSLLKDSIQQGALVPMCDRSLPGSPIRKESTPIRYSAPEITLCGSHQQSTSRKFNMLLSDRTQATSNDSAVELKPIVGGAARNTNDLISKDRMQPVISSANAFAFVDGISDGKENGNGRADKCDAGLESVEDLDSCELEKYGSPCSHGGLHMPDSKSLSNFAMHMKHIRSRHNSQCNSDSERFSPSNSPQDRVNYFKNSKVRRTNSCPEMKKSSPNSTTLSSDSPVLEERDENDELYDLEKGVPTRRKTKKPTSSKVTIETQTDDVPAQGHFPYEHLFLDVFPPLHPSQYEEKASPAESTNSLEERSPASVYKKAHSPSKLLQKYIDAAGQCYNDKVEIRDHKSPSIALENKYLLDQLKLMGVQLQLEEHKRELHAERNRRLLPRSRRNKTLEEHNNALMAQVKLLQIEIQNCNDEVTKIVKEKEDQISREQVTATYWRDRFGSLKEKYKTVKSRCQNVEALLKEEKDANAHNIKELNMTKAELGDITNDLKSCQKDAMEVKHLRELVVPDLQSEITKAGELLKLYRDRLIEAHLPIDNKAQVDDMILAYMDDREKLRKVISDQKSSLEATQTIVNELRKEIENRNDEVDKLNHELKTTQESLEKAVQDWKTKHDEIKVLYDQEKIRASDFEMQANRIRFLMKTNSKMAPQKDMSMRRGNTPLADDGAGSGLGGSRSSQSVPKSLKNYTHSAQQQMMVGLECLNSEAIPASEPIRPAPSPISDQPKEWDPQLRTKAEKTPSPTMLVSRESSVDGEGGTGAGASGMIKSITKKKTRTECAESGQLRPISYTQLDPEPPTRKE